MEVGGKKMEKKEDLVVAVEYLKKAAEVVEKELDRYISVQEPEVIFEAMRYSLLGGGKRLRAALAILAAYGEEELAIPAACAVEMVHAYSLIHDDLPCMDNDDFRRGKPSCHKAFDEATALLAGDALLTKAFETVLDLKYNPLMAARELAVAAGAEGMVGGQVLDLSFENTEITYDELKKIHSKKTGALITVSLRLGALAARRESLLAKYTLYGNNIGLAFQITDDILDVIGDPKKLGKTLGKDKEQGKSTYPTLFGMERSVELAKEAVAKAIDAANGLPGEEILVGLAQYVLVRES